MNPTFRTGLKILAVIFIVLGLCFLIVAAIMQIVPINLETLVIHTNGITRSGTPADLPWFRLIFLLVFGILGSIFVFMGSVVAIVLRVKYPQNRAVKVRFGNYHS